MNTYELTVGEFKGPLEKLLELIEAEEMDVSEVSMARVTDDFLKYLDVLKSSGLSDAAADEMGVEKVRMDLRILADFVAVASRLIFLKSKYLLPGLALSEEEEADVKDLEDRLLRYKALKPAFKYLHKLWNERHMSYSRPYFLGRGAGLAEGQKIFYPGENISIDSLAGALGQLLDTMKTYEIETETIREKIVTLEEKISEVIGRIRAEGDLHFKHLSGSKSRGEMIVVFLAILHLAREQLVLLEQIDAFSDIMVKKK